MLVKAGEQDVAEQKDPLVNIWRRGACFLLEKHKLFDYADINQKGLKNEPRLNTTLPGVQPLKPQRFISTKVTVK